MERRYRLLRICDDLLLSLLRLDGTRLIRCKGMPKDARIVGVRMYNNFMADEMAFIIESEEFAPVHSGQKIPEMTIEIDQIDPNFPN